MTVAEFRENLGVALDTLRSHKVRSTLTIVGIVIGVTSVISVAAIIEGLNRYIQQRVEAFGSRTYFITRIPVGPTFGRMPQKIRQRKYIQYGDAAALRELSKSIDSATTFGTRGFFFATATTRAMAASAWSASSFAAPSLSMPTRSRSLPWVSGVSSVNTTRNTPGRLS